MANEKKTSAAPVIAAIPVAIGLAAVAIGPGEVGTTAAGIQPAATAVVELQFTSEEQELVDEHAFGGLPSTVNVNVRRGYIRSYLPEARVPAWVAYHVTPDYRNTPPRKGKFSSFRKDPDLDNAVRDGDYTGFFTTRGYARGHLAPFGVMGGDRDGDGQLAADEDPEDTETVFQANYMSNMAPQHHLEFNGSGGLWFDLERKIQDVWVEEQQDEVWVFAGCVIGRGAHEVIGPENDIVVPPMFFKIVIREPLPIDDEELGPEGDLPRVLAFLFPHQRVRHGDLEDFLVSINVVEALTGLDFFNELAEEVQERFEDVDTRENWESFQEV